MKIQANKWRYTLKNSKALRSAINSEDMTEVLKQIFAGYEELRDEGLIDEDDFESYTSDFELYLDDPEDTVDYELSNFYDLCDNIGVWIEL